MFKFKVAEKLLEKFGGLEEYKEEIEKELSYDSDSSNSATDHAQGVRAERKRGY